MWKMRFLKYFLKKQDDEQSQKVIPFKKLTILPKITQSESSTGPIPAQSDLSRLVLLQNVMVLRGLVAVMLHSHIPRLMSRSSTMEIQHLKILLEDSMTEITKITKMECQLVKHSTAG